MPANRNALVRYKTIDNCLQRRNRKWTLEDLMDACSEALYEYEGIDKGVSKRTTQADIQVMRSDKLGYNAPIVVVDKKYYTYEDSTYSITNIPLSQQDLGLLSESVNLLKQFKGFSHFRELESMVQKLEDHVYAQQTSSRPVIDFEKNENLKGLEFLDQLYQYIIKRQAIKITYQSFKARSANTFNFHPYLLKEFRNRWFLIGKKKASEDFYNLALDRIIEVAASEIAYCETDFDAEQYFKNVIGVSVSDSLPTEEVLIYVNHKHAPYLITKPLHHSQKEIKRDHFGVTLSLAVQLNFELEKELLGLGESIRILAPERLKRKIRERLNTASENYQNALTEKGIKALLQKQKYQGVVVLQQMYSQRAIRNISRQLHRLLGDQLTYKVDLLPLDKLVELLLNRNVNQIISHQTAEMELVSATYFPYVPTSAYQDWHQLTTIAAAKAAQTVVLQIHLCDTSAKNARQAFLKGSQRQQHSSIEKDIIVKNAITTLQEANKGNVYLFSPLILTKFEAAQNHTTRPVIRLVFAPID